jgi:hypothetical protein
MINGVTQSCNRPVQFIPLPPPSKKSVGLIFEEFTLPHFIIGEVSSHWRSIMILFEYYTYKGQSKEYNDLSTMIINQISGYTSVQEIIVEACFSRKPYNITDVIGTQSVSFLISNGTFLNSIENEKLPIYPEIPLLFLKSWASQKFHYTSIQLQLYYLFQLDNPVTYNFSSFESYYYVYWLSIFHYCRCESDDYYISINDFFYSLLIINSDSKQKIYFKKKMTVENIATLDNISNIDFSNIYLLGGSNFGFDSIIFYQTKEKKTVAIAFENKYSRELSTTVFAVADLKKKRDQTVNEVSKRFKDMKSENIFLVFVL